MPNTNDIVRLSSTGTVDASFSTGVSGFSGGVCTLLLDSNEKLLAGGNFNFYNENQVNQLVRLNANGMRDISFASPLNADIYNFVYRLYKQSDDKILVGGGFASPRGGLLHLGGNRTPFDFDGDGKSDFTVFRNGYWYVIESATPRTNIVKFGTDGDNPIPGFYVGS